MDPAATLAALCADPDHVALDRALLTVAAARPGGAPPVDDGIARLDEYAAHCADPSPEGVLDHICTGLGFRGDRADYHDRRNSLLDEVLRRRVGMPITLSVVVIEVGRRVGVDFHGVGMPGHFLVASRTRPGRWFDVFDAGMGLDVDGCAERFGRLHPGLRFDVGYLDAVPPGAIVTRVLNNLMVTARTRRPADLDWILGLRLALPVAPSDRRALAGLCEARGRYDDAAALLEAPVDAADPPSTTETRRARRLRARLN